MSSFTKPLDVRKLPDGKFLLLTTFEYFVGSEDSSESIVVPSGLISDGASIPKFLWTVIGHPMDKYAQAAFLHDWICRERLYSRKRCDQIFLEAMGVLKVSKIKRTIMYWGLRIFGWYMWNKGDKK